MSYNHADYNLLVNESTTGSAVRWPGGVGVFTLFGGTIGGATVTLQWSPDRGTTWLDVDRDGDDFVTLTDTGSGKFELPRCHIRAAVSGGTPSGLKAKAFGVA